MRLGTLILQSDPWATGVHHWTRAEELGVSTAYTADHVTHRTVAGTWWADGYTTLAAAAGATSTIGLGTLVASAAVRSPAWLARVSATLQDLSGGRFVLGLGAGTADDAEADTGTRPTAAQLGRRFREVVPAVRALWDGETGYRGERLGFDGVLPAPLAPGSGRPRLVVAAHGARGIDVAARHADGWTTYGVAGADRATFWAGVQDQGRVLDAACDRLGRDRQAVSRCVLIGYAGYRPFESVESFVEDVERAEAAGIDEVAFYWPTAGPGSAFSGDPGVVEAAVAAVLGPDPLRPARGGTTTG